VDAIGRLSSFLQPSPLVAPFQVTDSASLFLDWVEPGFDGGIRLASLGHLPQLVRFDPPFAPLQLLDC
jgi:hypothetical protein